MLGEWRVGFEHFLVLDFVAYHRSDYVVEAGVCDELQGEQADTDVVASPCKN